LIVHIKLNFFNRTMKGVSHPLLTCIVADI
jgi:hypothetical protein